MTGQPSAAELLAQTFHDIYEELAPSFGYETREASAKPWAEIPEANRALMIAVAERLLRGRLHDAAMVYAYELGHSEARRDGVCGVTWPADVAEHVPPAWSGACALRPEHAGLHENEIGLRWGVADGRQVVDASAVPPALPVFTSTPPAGRP